LSDLTWPVKQEPSSADMQFQSVDKISATLHL